MNDLCVWDEPYDSMIEDHLRAEARRWHRLQQLPAPREGWETKRKALRNAIWNRLGTRPDHELDLALEVHKTIPMEGYQVQCVSYQSRPGMRVTANLYVPDGKGPFPGVIGVHGHWSEGRLATRVQSRGHTLARNGFVCLNIDAFGSGERSTVHGTFEYHGGQLGFSLFDIGETLMGIQVVDNMRGVDLLQSLDTVDPDRIGATGASGGGNQTMWLAAMDDRIKAAVPVVSVGTFESYVGATNCVCEVLPDGLTLTEESGVLALTAPRALKICNALKDGNPTFFPSEMLRSFVPARAIYQLYGEDRKFSYQVFNLPHGYWPEVRESMLGWFDYWLKDKGDGHPRAELPFKTLAEEDVMCFPKGKRPDEVVTIAGLCRARGRELTEKRACGKAIDAREKRHSLLELLRATDALQLCRVHDHGPAAADPSLQRLSVETTSGLLFPALFRPPDGDGDITLVLHDQGKTEALRHAPPSGGRRTGNGRLYVDLWGTGEIPWQESMARGGHHDLSRACLWLGRTLMGEWVKSILLIHRFMKEHMHAERLFLEGTGAVGLAGLYAASMGGGFASVHLKAVPGSLCFGSEAPRVSLSVHVPGFLAWGDVSLAAALCEGELFLRKPVHLDTKPYDKQASEQLAQDIAALKARCGTAGSVDVSTK